jgi:hypothetical protein
VAHEDEKREFEAGTMSLSKRRNYLKKCEKEVANMPDVVRNYFYDVMSWHQAQYGRSIDYAQIEGMYSGKLHMYCSIMIHTLY